MRVKTLVLCSASTIMLALGATPALAQNPPPPPPPSGTGDAAAGQTNPAAPDTAADNGDENAIVVTGLRRSLQSAQNIKKNSVQQIDAIVAEDIGKLPDIAVSETAARIPGIEVTRRAGEADTVLIRGLPDFTTTYNGREIFTAETRVVALQDFPAANIAALEVFKTTTADLVEAGLAGLVNVRSRRPFDFKGLEIAGSAWALYPRQSGKVTPNGNLLISDRWSGTGGDFGALINLSYTELQYLDSENSNTDFVANSPAGRLPDIQRVYYRSGNRVRPSVNAALQWRPHPGLEFYVEGLYQGFRNKIDDHLVAVPLWGGSSYTNIQLRPGTDLVQSGTVANPFRPDGFQGGTYNKTDTYQFAGGGSFESGPFRMTGDLAYTNSKFTGSTESVDYAFRNRQTVIFNSGLPQGAGGGPEFSFANFDAANPANYVFRGFYEEAQVSKGHDWQARLDAQYETQIPFLSRIEAGLRWTDHKAHREFGNRYASFESRGISITQVPLDYQLFRPGFRGTDLQDGFRTWLAPTYESIRDNIGKMRQYVINLGPPGDGGFGTWSTADPAPDPLQTYNASERSLAGYVQARYKIGETVDGVVGLRAVRTTERVSGTSLVQQTAGPAVFTPVSVSNSHTDWLPNASLRAHLTDQVQFRLSATKTRTMPTFAQLNPSASLGVAPTNCPPGSTDPYACARSGGGGNPYLKPFTSWNYDASLEYYFSRTGLFAVAVFRRDLKGFIQNQQIRYIDPVLGPLIINGPVNTNKGRINGAEAQFSTFFDWEWVPDFLHGFGAQANVTYLDAKVAGARILGVSKWTYNLVGMYERGGFSARLSYNKRTSTLETVQNRGDDIYIETGAPAGRLDLSTSYNVNRNFTLFFDWTNILNKPYRQDLSSARAGAPRSEWTRFFRFEEQIFSGGVRFHF
ncbi:MAG: TonB-dependent receptor [Alphaproteobacteria bacterium]|nr:TonB-dependent receptor [Alphaproteobacteria bacterium]